MNSDSIALSNTDKLLKSWGYSLIDEYKEMAAAGNFSKSEPVFDFATGGGRMAAALTRLGHSVITGDFSLDKYEQAQQRISPFKDHVQFLLLDMEMLPFATAACDSIICVNTVHELQNPYRCLDELSRIHSRKGSFVLADFNAFGFDTMDRSEAEIYGGIHNRGSLPIQTAADYLAGKGYNFQSIELALNTCFIADAR